MATPAGPGLPVRGRWHGDDAWVLDSGAARAVVLPGRGGKVVSLRGSREWLAQPVLPLRPPARPGAAFTGADMAGWDECAPTVDACEVATADGRPLRLPDHGDLWTAPWPTQAHPAGPGRAAADGPGVVSRVDAPSGYRFERRAGLLGAVLTLSYRVEAAREMPFLWAAHPQLVAPPGTVVEVPPEVGALVDVTGHEAGPVRPLGARDRAVGAVAPGGCRKWYADPAVPVGSAALRHPDGGTLQMAWSAAVAPYLGVWVDRGAFAREDVVALEPSTGWFDSCARAARSGRVAVVGPGRPLAWTLRVHVG